MIAPPIVSDPDPADWFPSSRYGMFIHFGLYSAWSRGEWVMNREEISPEEMRRFAETFNPSEFDAGALADLAVAGGMKYIVFTTMHHDGFRMYHSELSDFCSTKMGPRRDFVSEIVSAARIRGLKIGLYHSLNNWYDQPDAVAALENPASYEIFIAKTFARIRELASVFQPIDILWYDGWWPFDAAGWQAEKMNAMVRAIQPKIIFNGRNGLPGDFATPEQHLSAPDPWRPWEACVTLNDNWGFHAGDHNWKSAVDVIKLLVRAAQGRGNVLLNIGPRGDGSIPEESGQIVRSVGAWLKVNGECIFGTEIWTFDPQLRGDHRGDWSSHGLFTAKGNDLYLILTSPPRDEFALTGFEASVENVSVLGSEDVFFHQSDGRVRLRIPRSLSAGGNLPPVVRLRCDRPPVLYKTGGMRVPAARHPRYDPIAPDLAW